jgi:hydrogenase expression/formation protein HypD
VTAIIGTEPYRFIAEKYATPCVVTGFDAADIITGISMLLRQTIEGRAAVEIQYEKVVKPEGNPKAVEFITTCFEPSDSNWRGIGVLPGSGLVLRDQWRHRAAEKAFPLDIPESHEPKGCLCGLVLRGVKMPSDCPLFAKVCIPERPVGACMVSSEGSCAAYYRYKDILPQE